MGSIKKTISFDEYVYEIYLKDVEGNFSKFIQRLVVAGHEAIEGKHEFYKKQTITLTNKITDYQIETRNLKSIIEKLKKRSSKSPEAIIQKHDLTKNDLVLLKECKQVVLDKPEFIEGNLKRFNNETAKNISLVEFKSLINFDLDSFQDEFKDDEDE